MRELRWTVNLILKIFKWPLCIMGLFFLLPIIKADLEVIHQGIGAFQVIWFVLPMLLTCLLWFLLPELNGSFLAIFEHEATHMLFALLTFHRPSNLVVIQDKGGLFSFEGEGNWLIVLAPYFVPTFVLFTMLASLVYLIMGEALPHAYWIIMGVMTGYHIVSTLVEIHPKQPDFKEAGFLFSFLFLPVANLFHYGMILAFVSWGWSGLKVYFGLIWEQFLRFLTIFMA